MIQSTPLLVALAAVFAPAALAADGLNPYTGRQEREQVFQFAVKPTVEKKGDGYVIRFASKTACDATIAIVDKDGRIVHHLASGVLGKNAPWPFKQGTLEQELVWDGRNDDGKPVDASKCRVQVALGLKARLANVLGWSPAKATERKAFAVGPKGNVYVLDGGHATCCQPSPNIRVFDWDCRYLRRILPPMSSVPPERSTFLKWNRTTWSTHVPERMGGHYAVTLSPYASGAGMQTPVVTGYGRFLWTTCQWIRGRGHTFRRLLFMVDVRDGAMPPGSIVTVDPECEIMGKGSIHMALSPDDRWLYFGAPVEKKNTTRHAVFRMDMKQPGPVSVFLGKPNEAGPDNEHLNNPVGVACDKDGNLYVGDCGNDRIQVFTPDGHHLKTLPVENFRLFAVSRGTGAIYVERPTGERHDMRLLKLGGLNDPTVKASWDGISTLWGNDWPCIGVDSGGENDVVWIMKEPGGIGRLEDQGDSFKELPLGDHVRQAKGWEHWQPWAGSGAIVADPTREEIYAREWSSCWPSGAVRADGRTGQVIERFLAQGRGGHIESMAVGPGGDLYLRLFKFGTVLARYNPGTGKLVPLKGAEPIERKGRPVMLREGQPMIGIEFPVYGGARSFQDQMAVAPNGDIYMPVGIHESDHDRLKKLGQEVAYDKLQPSQGNILQVYGPDGTLKCSSALPGLGASNGIGIGRHGAVYMVLQCQPVDVKSPEGLSPDSHYDEGAWATVVKFNSRFDKFPIGRIAGRWTGQKLGTPPHLWKLDGEPTHRHGGGPDVRIENMLWDYPGASPVRMSGCTCHRSTLSLDGFERVFVPAAQTCSVNVLDANGNIVARIGAYGNADCRGKDSPVPDPKTSELRPRREGDPEGLKSPLAEPDIAFIDPTYTAVTDEALYVLDRANERIVRAALEYETEKIVPLP